MILLLISLIITAIATLIQTFWKMKTLKPRLIFTAIILAGITVSYFVTKDDAIKNDKLQADMERSQLLLQSANEKITIQSQAINTGFSNLTAQMSREGVNNEAILITVKNLEANIQRLTIDSKNFISEALELSDNQGLPRKNENIYIPLGDKNAVAVDTKNQFAVSSDTPDENNKIKVIMNGRERRLAPGEQIYFTDDQGHKAYLVYKGSDNKKMIFFVKSH